MAVSKGLTRRELLRLGVLAALGSGLASCTGPQSLSGLASATPHPTTLDPPTLTPAPAATASATATVEGKTPAWLHEALYYTQLDDNRVQCQMCFRRCVVGEGYRGFCHNKVNFGGRYYTVVYGHPSALQIDPIEKEPCFHMWPGATIFCTGMASCNNRCKFCQNWHLSQRRFEEIEHTDLDPTQSVDLALEMGCDAVSFTYNEPTVSYEHMLDTARLAGQAGLGRLFHTNGGMNEEPLAELLASMDAVTVDLKAFTPEFYRDVSDSELEPVLRSLQQIHQSGKHLEIVNLMVPTLNDDEGDARRMCSWIRDTLSAEVPLHFTRFHPAYKLTNLPQTPLETLERAAEIADEEGLQYVYIGNYPGHERNSTYCPACGERIIGRAHFAVQSMDVEKGRCRFCGHDIPGIWRDAQAQPH